MPPLRGSNGVMGLADLGLAPQAIQIAPLRGAFGKTLQPRVPDCMRAYLGNPVLRREQRGLETQPRMPGEPLEELPDPLEHRHGDGLETASLVDELKRLGRLHLDPKILERLIHLFRQLLDL